jgi:hypothetical protein
MKANSPTPPCSKHKPKVSGYSPLLSLLYSTLYVCFQNTQIGPTPGGRCSNGGLRAIPVERAATFGRTVDLSSPGLNLGVETLGTVEPTFRLYEQFFPTRTALRW